MTKVSFPQMICEVSETLRSGSPHALFLFQKVVEEITKRVRIQYNKSAWRAEQKGNSFERKARN